MHKLTLKNHVAIIEMDRENSLLSPSCFESFRETVKKVMSQPSIYVVLLMLRRSSHFSVNVGLSQIEKIHGKEQIERRADEIYELFESMKESKISWVSVIQGPCLGVGSGLELALASDYRMADFDEHTVFKFQELSLGLLPAFGASLRLLQLLGVKKTMELFLNGSSLSSSMAHHLSLVDELVHSRDIEKKALCLADEIIAGKKTFHPERKTKALRLSDQWFESPMGRQLMYYRIKKKIVSRTKTFYPAPLKFIELVKKIYPIKRLKLALKTENQAFCDLAITSASKHLRFLSLAKEKLDDRWKTSYIPAPIEKVAVLGAGQMGSLITHWLIDSSHLVLLKDIHRPSFSSAFKIIDFLLDQQCQQGMMQEEEKRIRLMRVHPQTDESGFRHVDLVIETVLENEEIKKKVIAETAKHLPEKTLFATNTSSLSVSELAKAHPVPSRFVGLHFFYPVHKVPLVEVVRGEQTSEKTLLFLTQWLKKRGKTALVVKDRPGFLVNRLLCAFVSEALWCLQDGVNIQAIDQVYTSFGFRMGPFRLMDEIGLDLCLTLMKSCQSAGVFLDLPECVFTLRPTFLGRKNKIGFYVYDDQGQAERVNDLIYQNVRLKQSSLVLSEKDILERGLYRLVNEAGKALLEEKIVDSASELDLALVLGMGFPAFRGGLLKYADEISLETITNQLNTFSQTLGDRFRPVPSLLEKVSKRQNFYQNVLK